jgi:hypothetical protein
LQFNGELSECDYTMDFIADGAKVAFPAGCGVPVTRQAWALGVSPTTVSGLKARNNGHRSGRFTNARLRQLRDRLLDRVALLDSRWRIEGGIAALNAFEAESAPDLTLAANRPGGTCHVGQLTRMRFNAARNYI